MSYVISHHGTLWFQIRVPSRLEMLHGKVVRVNLQTRDPALARVLSLRLASEWLSRFQEASALAAVPGYAPIGEASPDFDAASTEPGARPHVVSEAQQSTAVVEARPQAPCPTKQLTDKALFDAWARIDTTRASSSIGDMKAAMKAFRSSCRKPWASLERKDIADFRDHLLSKRLARGTVAKQIGFISTLLQVGYDTGLLKQNPARGLKVPRAEVPTLERRAFTTQELQRIFSSPVYADDYRPVAGCGPACVWMPMIGLVTGARLEEIAQLLTHDIIEDPEYGPLMRITDEGESQRLKTIGSRRIVPLHPEIVRAGFLDYVALVREAGQQWLFPELLPDHDARRGGNFGKWFQRYLRQPSGIGITDRRVVFHSFRHTFKTLCRAAGISEEVHDALTGHVSSSVSRRYGEMPIGPLFQAIRAIKLPVALPRIDV